MVLSGEFQPGRHGVLDAEIGSDGWQLLDGLYIRPFRHLLTAQLGPAQVVVPSILFRFTGSSRDDPYALIIPTSTAYVAAPLNAWPAKRENGDLIFSIQFNPYLVP